MYKVVLLLHRQGSLSVEEFSQRWRDGMSVDPAFDDAPIRHVHNRALTGDMPIENAPPAAFDGIDEFWFADARAASAYFGSPTMLDRMARCAELLAEPPRALGGATQVLWHRAVTPVDPVKIITLPARRAGMTPQAFGHHWIDVHFKLGIEGPGTRMRLQRYEVCLCGDGPPVPVFSAAPFDGVGTIEFASRADLQAEFSSPYYREVMAPDEPRFTDPMRSSAMLVEPSVVSG